MKNTLRKGFFFLALTLITAGSAFAQRVGDTGQFTGSSDTWRVQSVSGNTMTLEKVVAQGDDPVNWIAVPDSSFGTTAINGVAFGNNRWVAVGQSGKIAYSSDGRSWTGVAMPNSNSAVQNNKQGIAFGNNRYIAVGTNGKMAYCDW